MNKALLKFISTLMVFCTVLSVNLPMSRDTVIASAEQSLEDKRAQLQRELDAVEIRLAQLSKQSRDTEEYIEVLDQKISFLDKEYKLIKDDADEVGRQVSALEHSIKSNKAQTESTRREIKALTRRSKKLDKRFESVYAAYCKRLRALYISGEQSGTLEFIFKSDGISNLLTRYEMVRAVSKRDGELLKEVQKESAEILKTREKLNSKTKRLKSAQLRLKENRESLKQKRETLLQKQEEMDAKLALIEEQQAEENRLLKELHEKTKEYGEFRDTAREELEKIDADIAAADEKYPEPETQATTATSETTTDEATTAESTTRAYRYLKLTYPCPKYTKITCAFGAYSGHTGCDFSTDGHENQKIVAAESGTVILVKLLESSYGHYIVIRHDKKTKSGESAYTLYAHNNKIVVTEGQYVKKGQKIANSGSTGNSTGPHCHFEVRIGGSSQSYAKNPEHYLP